MEPEQIREDVYKRQGFMHILLNMLWLYWFGALFLSFFSAKHLRGVYILEMLCREETQEQCTEPVSHSILKRMCMNQMCIRDRGGRAVVKGNNDIFESRGFRIVNDGDVYKRQPTTLWDLTVPPNKMAKTRY